MDVLQMANGVASLLAACALIWVVLSPRVYEGVVIKTGLIAMVLSLLTTAAHTLGGTDDWAALWAAGFVLRAGLLVVVLGLLLRRYRCGSWSKATDWSVLP